MSSSVSTDLLAVFLTVWLDDRLDDEPFNFSLVSLPDLFICNTQASHPFMYFRIYKYIKIKGYDRGKYHSEGLFENRLFEWTESKWICLFDFWIRFRSHLECTVNYLTLTNPNNYVKLDSLFELFWSDSEGFCLHKTKKLRYNISKKVSIVFIKNLLFFMCQIVILLTKHPFLWNPDWSALWKLNFVFPHLNMNIYYCWEFDCLFINNINSD